jgi:hypothetical protein
MAIASSTTAWRSVNFNGISNSDGRSVIITLSWIWARVGSESILAVSAWLFKGVKRLVGRRAAHCANLVLGRE